MTNRLTLTRPERLPVQIGDSVKFDGVKMLFRSVSHMFVHPV